MSLEPYEHYKEGGVSWMMRVPASWDVRRVKTLFEIRKRIVGEEGPDVLSVTQQGIRIKDIASNDGQLAMDYSKYQIVQPGDFVMNQMDLLTGWIDIATTFGVTSPDYRVFAARTPHLIQDAYFLYVFQNAYQQKIFYALGQGASHFGRWRLPREGFYDFLLPFPPKDEQVAIADFLDHETEKIDSLIRLSKEFVGLVDQQLDAQKNYILTGKTRGPCKSSGVKWIGDVPGTWQVAPIGRIARSIETGPFGSQLHASDYEPGGVPVINPAHLVGGLIAADEKSAVSQFTANRLGRHQLMEGDLILARRGEVGRCAIVQSGEVGWLCGTGSMKLRLTQDNDPEYFNLVMSCSGPLEQLLLHSVGSTMPNVNPTIMSRLVVPVPPLSEQRDIVAEVSQIILRANRLKNSIASVVDLLTEYRSALISAAVTGQIDVRYYRPQEAAALCQ